MYLGVPVETTDTIGMQVVLVPPGKYIPELPDKLELRRVQVATPFYLDVHEVTQKDYQEAMGFNPSWFSASGVGRDWVKHDTGRHPVENISWLDAVAFCNKLSAKEGLKPCYDETGERLGGDGYRLPTEAEWELACRAGTKTTYSFGDSAARLGDHGRYLANSGNRTHPVGEKKENAFGLYDMHGNVWEWCEDWYEKGSLARVRRGGCWDNTAVWCQSAYRSGYLPADRNGNLGFRVARSLLPQERRP